MKLEFKKQQYQADATNAVVRCFSGQPKGISEDKIKNKNELLYRDIFSNKKLEISEETILENVRKVQELQNLKPNKKLDGNGKEFTIEMETGTGKTYVYTKTMFELNKAYGWNKFIIMVPSIAIREGVLASLDLTEDHFFELYKQKIRSFIYDTKNKTNLINIKNFSTTSNIEVIIMNYQAYNTKTPESRKIYQELDELQSEKPIDIIKQTNPILIIDEPQKFGESINLLKEFNPLFTLRYSATHKDELNKIYRLDAIDAYSQKLVKKIGVKGIEVKATSGTNSYLFLDRINIKVNQDPTANIELEIRRKTGIKKEIRVFNKQDDLYEASGKLQQYKGFVIKEILGNTNTVLFTNGKEISCGKAIGNVNEDQIRRIQIRETIKSHLEKEQNLFNRGIKVLSLFFIDEVAKYRKYDENNNQLKGDYAKMFEEEYEAAIKENQFIKTNENYKKYIESHSAEQIHNGYFSIDNKGKLTQSKKESTDVNAYDLIMKNKKRLLSFEESTRFIFSHSTLREGWDNQNIFQICTLKQSNSTISRRQEIGRGLRICVNTKGQRMDYSVLENEFFDVNKLTVIASESYDKFSRELQKEITDSLSNRPIKLTTELLTNTEIKNSKGELLVFSEDDAMDFIFDLKTESYLNEKYEVTEKLIAAIEKEQVIFSDKFIKFKEEICNLLLRIYDAKNYKPAIEERANNINEINLQPNDNFYKKEFKELWEKIKSKTAYEVNFDSEELIGKSIVAIDKKLKISKTFINIVSGEQKEKMDMVTLNNKSSFEKKGNESKEAPTILGALKYDLIAEISKGTKLLRKTIVRILEGISEDRFNQFKRNPEKFIAEITKLINVEKAATLIDNIEYHKINETYSTDIFTINNFQGSLSENILEVKKHIFDYLKTDSKTERKLGLELDLQKNDISVYAKLPSGFKISTPVGSYNPDWAIVFDNKKIKHIYFIAETKGSLDSLQLKKIEDLKIKYAQKHFNALGDENIRYDVITNYQDLLNVVR